MIRRDIDRVRTHDQRLTLLASLPTEMLGDFLGHQLRHQSVKWLDAAVDAGCFDLSREVFDRTPTPSRYVAPVAEAVDASLLFLRESTELSRSNKDPNNGLLPIGMHALTLHAEAEFSNAFDRMVLHFCDDYQQTMMRVKSLPEERRVDVRVDLEDATVQMLAKLMVGAIALGRPDTLGRLLRANLDAIDETLNTMDICGESMDLNTGYGVPLTPYGFAMQFSQIECMDLIKSAYGQRVPVVCQKNVGAKGSVSYDALHAHEVMGALCFPSAYAKAMMDCIALRGNEPGFMDSAARYAIRVLTSDYNDSASHYVNAFIDAGLYDVNPALAFETAVNQGRLSVVHHFKGQVPWDNLSSTADPARSLLIDALGLYAQEGITPEKRDVIDLVMKMARDDERLDLVLRITPQPGMRHDNDTLEYNGPVFLSPIGHVIGHEMQEVLHEFLKNGLDPDIPLAPDAWTVQKLADTRSDAMGGFVRAFSARKHAMEIIMDMTPDLCADEPFAGVKNKPRAMVP